jgi:pyruvate formate lyase activating enzyme
VRGLVFNIQRFSIHDGPGIRTTVFLKGCDLRCFWCHNPEGLGMGPELQFFQRLCIGCGECVKACPFGAHGIVDGVHEFRREACSMSVPGAAACELCAKACPAQALLLSGRPMELEEVAEELLRDAPFYQSSGGGVTLSGGEPLLQKEFSRALLSRLKAEGIGTALETAGLYPWEWIEDILPLTDLVMMDIKHMDSAAHERATGARNELILANARRLALEGPALIFRVPVIPTVNDSPEEIAAIRDFVARLRGLRRGLRGGREPISLELLSFHPLALDKYGSMGMDNPSARLAPLSRERMDELSDIARLDT